LLCLHHPTPSCGLWMMCVMFVPMPIASFRDTSHIPFWIKIFPCWQLIIRVKTKPQKKGELPFVYSMMLLSTVVNRLLSKKSPSLTRKKALPPWEFSISSRITLFVPVIWNGLFCILNSLCCCYRYYVSFLPFLLEACNDECSDVRQVPTSGLLHINVYSFVI
jgi:hypothetical protein